MFVMLMRGTEPVTVAYETIGIFFKKKESITNYCFLDWFYINSFVLPTR